MRAAEHAPRGPFQFLERRHGLAEVIERGGGVHMDWLPRRPEHTSRGPAKLTQLEPTSLEADRDALWSASEAAIGEKWEL